MEFIFVMAGFVLGIIAALIISAANVSKNTYRYSYHVAYSYEDRKGRNGYGSMNIGRKEKARSKTGMESMHDFIVSQNDLKSAVIINVIDITD